MTSYEIIKELRRINEMQDEIDETSGEYKHSEEEIAKAYKAINAKKEDKLNAIEDYKRSIKKEQELYEEKKKKQEANIKRCKNKVEYLKELQESLLRGEKLKTDEYTFSYRKSVSVKITNESKLLENDKYVKVKRELDKTAIKQNILSGDLKEGAELETKTSLSIR